MAFLDEIGGLLQQYSGGSNIIFADGHVRWQRWQSIRWEQTCPQGVNSSNTWCSTP